MDPVGVPGASGHAADRARTGQATGHPAGPGPRRGCRPVARRPIRRRALRGGAGRNAAGALRPTVRGRAAAARVPGQQDLRRRRAERRACDDPPALRGGARAAGLRPAGVRPAPLQPAAAARRGLPGGARPGRVRSHRRAMAGAGASRPSQAGPTARSCRCPSPTSCPAGGSRRSTTGIPTSPCWAWSRAGAATWPRAWSATSPAWSTATATCRTATAPTT